MPKWGSSVSFFAPLQLMHTLNPCKLRSNQCEPIVRRDPIPASGPAQVNQKVPKIAKGLGPYNAKHTHAWGLRSLRSLSVYWSQLGNEFPKISYTSVTSRLCIIVHYCVLSALCGKLIALSRGNRLDIGIYDILESPRLHWTERFWNSKLGPTEWVPPPHTHTHTLCWYVY